MRLTFALIAGLGLPAVASAAHPLITEDTGTQGAGRYQLEITTEHGHDRGAREREHRLLDNAVLAAGVSDALDVIATVPYQRLHAEGGAPSREGLGDVGLDLKWRFLEVEAWSMALKPGLTLPTGEEDEGLGSGRARYSAFLVTCYMPQPWAVHLHVGYLDHRNTLGERESIRQSRSPAGASGMTAACVSSADLGRDTNTDGFRDRSRVPHRRRHLRSERRRWISTSATRKACPSRRRTMRSWLESLSGFDGSAGCGR